MSYTHLRAVAYQVPTIGFNGGFLEIPPGEIPGRFAANQPAAFAGVSNIDARKRLARLYAVMLEAQEQIAILGDSNYTLKVFVAPEFYFRPLSENSNITPKGPSYTLQEYREIKKALETLADDKKFINWVIIPGTILWSGSGMIGRKRPNTGDAEVFFNSSMFLKVGKLCGSQYQVIEKARASTIDGLPTGRHGGGGVSNPDRKSTDEQWPLYQTLEKKRKHVLEHHGTECGVEICLEHGMGLLKEILSAGANWKSGFLRNRKSIALQILTAGGKPIDDAFVTAKTNGYILRTDGLGSGVQSEMRKISGYTSNSLQPVNYDFMSAKAHYNPISVAVEHTINLAADLQVPDPGSSAGNHFPQLVKIFSRQPLP